MEGLNADGQATFRITSYHILEPGNTEAHKKGNALMEIFRHLNPTSKLLFTACNICNIDRNFPLTLAKGLAEEGITEEMIPEAEGNLEEDLTVMLSHLGYALMTIIEFEMNASKFPTVSSVCRHFCIPDNQTSYDKISRFNGKSPNNPPYVPKGGSPIMIKIPKSYIPSSSLISIDLNKYGTGTLNAFCRSRGINDEVHWKAIQVLNDFDPTTDNYPYQTNILVPKAWIGKPCVGQGNIIVKQDACADIYCLNCHTVKKKETLTGIARQYKTLMGASITAENILEWNSFITDPDQIREGDRLCIKAFKIEGIENQLPGTIVQNLGNGKFEIIGGNEYNGDNRIYLDDGNGGAGELIGYAATPLSFFDSVGRRWVLGSIIDINDQSGRDFLNMEVLSGLVNGFSENRECIDDEAAELWLNFVLNFLEYDNISPPQYIGEFVGNIMPTIFYYMIHARGREFYDFKTTAGSLLLRDRYRQTMEPINIEYMYRGMPIGEKEGLPIFASARDIGNITAGIVAANSGLTWNTARYGFDGLESYQSKQNTGEYTWVIEGMNTQYAQMLGYKITREIRRIITQDELSRLPGNGGIQLPQLPVRNSLIITKDEFYQHDY